MSTIKPGVAGIRTSEINAESRNNNLTNVNANVSNKSNERQRVSVTSLEEGSNISNNSSRAGNNSTIETTRTNTATRQNVIADNVINSNIIGDPNNVRTAGSTGTEEVVNEPVVQTIPLYSAPNAQVVKSQDKTLGTVLNTYA